MNITDFSTHSDVKKFDEHFPLLSNYLEKFEAKYNSPFARLNLSIEASIVSLPTASNSCSFTKKFAENEGNSSYGLDSCLIK